MPMRPVHFVTGTDEHGLKIQKAAQERNMEPQELCDRLGVAFSVRLRPLFPSQFILNMAAFSRAWHSKHLYLIPDLSVLQKRDIVAVYRRSGFVKFSFSTQYG